MTETKQDQPTVNYTPLRHRMLAAVANGEMTAIVECLLLPAHARRSVDGLRNRGLVTKTTRPAELTASGRELLAAWNEKHGEVSR